MLAMAWGAAPDLARAVGSSPFVGEISCGGWNFCPLGWTDCNGQLLPIAENETLFQLIGTMYGGDGQETFGLPNLSGRTMLGTGVGGGGSYVQGEMAGSETVTLTSSQTPVHTHALVVQDSSGDSASPANKVPAPVGATDNRYSSTSTGTLNTSAVGYVGGSQPHNNLQPYQAMKCCISLFGVFPTMN
jgi:microcystin-dependent protein